MIVKNESEIINRCLDAAQPCIDYVSICDTGSTDKTAKMIRNWGRRKNIPTKVWKVRDSLNDILKGLLDVINSLNDDSITKKNFIRKLNIYYEELRDWEGFTELKNICRYPNTVHANPTKFSDRVQGMLDEIENKVVRHPYDTTFQNFGYNRTQSFSLARVAFPKATYALTIDADMILQVKDLNKEDLTCDGYQIYQINPSLKYVNTRLMSFACDWKCVGVTHEYWSSSGHTHLLDDDKICIIDVGDGGCKDDKFKRDIRLLTNGLETESSHSLKGRYKFYLAQSYKDSHQMDSAIHWYQNRIKHGGWDEEVWYCHYMIGTCYMIKWRDIESKYHKFKNKKDAEVLDGWVGEMITFEALALRWMMCAYNLRPFRAEPIMSLAKYYREQGKNGLAHMYAKIASDDYMKRGMKDVLFVEHQMYRHLPYFELGITCYYLGRYEEGMEACRKLLDMEDIDTKIRTRTVENMKYYQSVVTE